MPKGITRKEFNSKDTVGFMKRLFAKIKDTVLHTNDYLIIYNGQDKEGNYELTVKQVGLEPFKDDVDLLLSKWKEDGTRKNPPKEEEIREQYAILSISKQDILDILEDNDNIDEIKKKVYDMSGEEMAMLVNKISDGYYNDGLTEFLTGYFEEFLKVGI